MKSKYRVITGVYEGHIFYGYELNGRIMDDHTVGRSYPIENCTLVIDVYSEEVIMDFLGWLFTESKIEVIGKDAIELYCAADKEINLVPVVSRIELFNYYLQNIKTIIDTNES